MSLLLSAGGLYAALSFGVGRRIQEIGVRMALGATSATVANLVLRQGLAVTAAGLVLGWLGALGGARLLRSFLFGVETSSITTFVTVGVCLLGVAVAASAGPALRAARVDPARSLQSD